MTSIDMKQAGSFRVLLVYANLPMEPLMPLGIANLATALQAAGFSVKLFDTTLYENPKTDDQADRILSQQIKPFDYSAYGVNPKHSDMFEDFAGCVEDYGPGLIGISCVENTYPLALRLLECIRDLGIPTIVGGVFATFAPEVALKSDLVDMVCVGEGEDAIVRVARQITTGEPVSGIPNIWAKENGNVLPATSYALVDFGALPVPQFDAFAPERIYRPMAGKIYRMIPVEISRGCPYMCTYCSAPSYARKFRGAGKWLRFKSIPQIIREIDYYCREYDVEYFYLVSETFLAMPKKDRDEFYSLYEKYRIPFWFNTRPETVREEDIRRLEEIGCHRMSVGIESGSEEFRTKMLRRNYTNDQVVRAVRTILNSNIQLSVNNMIGFPDETREMIFETIEVNREFEADSHTVSVFQPYRGTQLFEYCVQKGYWIPDRICDERFSEPVIETPSLSKEEIRGLYRTFNVYRKLDKALWPQIRVAERFDEEGEKEFIRLFSLANG